MPDADALRRVAALATCNERSERLHPLTDKIVEDCAQDYARTLNGIAFRAVHKADASNEFMQLLEPPALERKTSHRREAPVPHRTLVQSYEDAFASFRFQSCSRGPKSFPFLRTSAENEKILLLKPFNHVAKSTRVDDFGKLQRDATDAVAAKTEEGVAPALS